MVVFLLTCNLSEFLDVCVIPIYRILLISDHKFSPRSLPCVFLGICAKQQSIRCLYLSTGKVFIFRHVTFIEGVALFLSKFFTSSAPVSTISDFHMFHNFISNPSVLGESPSTIYAISGSISSTSLWLMILVLCPPMNFLSLFLRLSYYHTLLPP